MIGVKAIRDIEYANVGDISLRLDILMPAGAEEPARLPLIVCIHGGGWNSGDKSYVPPLPLAGQGYVLASIDYRLSQQAIFPAQIFDCKAAVRFLRAHATEYHIDPDRVGAWGNSAGGHLAALLATTAGIQQLEGDVGGNLEQPSNVQAVCDWHGPVDFLASTAEVQKSKGMTHQPGKALSQLLGGTPEQRPQLAKLASPLYHVTRSSAPFLIMHGDQDDAVPLQQSQQMAEALRNRGAQVTLIVVRGVGHKGELFDLNPVREFFDRHLKPAIAAL